MGESASRRSWTDSSSAAALPVGSCANLSGFGCLMSLTLRASWAMQHAGMLSLPGRYSVVLAERPGAVLGAPP